MVQYHKIMLLLGLVMEYVGEAVSPVRKHLISGKVGADGDIDFSDAEHAVFVRKQMRAAGNIDTSDAEAESIVRKQKISGKIGADGEIDFSDAEQASFVRKQIPPSRLSGGESLEQPGPLKGADELEGQPCSSVWTDCQMPSCESTGADCGTPSGVPLPEFPDGRAAKVICGPENCPVTLENQKCSSFWTDCQGCTSTGAYCGTPSGCPLPEFPDGKTARVVCGSENCPLVPLGPPCLLDPPSPRGPPGPLEPPVPLTGADDLEGQSCSSVWTDCQGCESTGADCGTPSGIPLPESPDGKAATVICGPENCQSGPPKTEQIQAKCPVEYAECDADSTCQTQMHDALSGTFPTSMDSMFKALYECMEA